ncbi:hypothetical protein DOY81_011621, partial [Sarcophaga bullata]
LNWTKFPCVLKAGHCHGGMATARFDNQMGLQDAAGLVTGTGFEGHCYCTIEPYIDAKFDVHIQKIGNNYKAFMRKSITGNWKTNQGSAMLEQITLTEKYKSWVDEISELFGGMEVCGVSVVVGKDGREYIIKASDSTFALMGDSQEDDRRQIADLVTQRMQNVCRPGMHQQQSTTAGNYGKLPSRSSVSSRGQSPTDEMGPPPAVGSIGRLSSRSSISEVPEENGVSTTTSAPAGGLPRRDSQTSQASTISSASRAAQRPPQTQSSVELAKQKRGRTASESGHTMTGETGSGGSGSGSAPATGIGGISVSGLTSAASSGLGDSVISTQPTSKPNEKPADARSDTSSTSTLTAGSVSSSSKPSSKRVNPFDKGTMKTSATTATIGGASTTSSSSISSSSISSRINARTDSNFKSPPPPSDHRHHRLKTPRLLLIQYHLSEFSNSNKDKTSYIYGSSTSIETITAWIPAMCQSNTAQPAWANRVRVQQITKLRMTRRQNLLQHRLACGHNKSTANWTRSG